VLIHALIIVTCVFICYLFFLNVNMKYFFLNTIFWGIYSISLWHHTGCALMYGGLSVFPHRFCSAKGPRVPRLGFEPRIYGMAGRHANHWAKPHPSLSYASPLLSYASPLIELASPLLNYASPLLSYDSPLIELGLTPIELGLTHNWATPHPYWAMPHLTVINY